MDDNLRLPTRPIAHPENVIAGDHWRVTVLTPGVVRLEHSPTGTFEDRASQMVLHRDLPPVSFQRSDSPSRLRLRTDLLDLSWDGQPLWPGGVSVTARGGVSNYHSTWRPGHPMTNLGGTARTLDGVDGRLELQDGVLSRDGVAVVDDSSTLVLGDDGWLHDREPGATDLYVFAHGRDYHAALDDLHALTGPQPLLPRFALGNWWSRYHRYSADAYLALQDRFRDRSVPFSVAVLDMDWHWVDIPPRFGSGWTGFSWNTDLFPDPPAFLRALHERGLAVTLNLHPADGIRAHEDAYDRLARRMGIDPSTGQRVPFDPTDPDFLQAYFDEVLHPLEDQGVDFWWVDWQQGTASDRVGLDPLWVLNHLHWLDSGRDGSRELTFSRYGGPGSHRYPIGFSGDTQCTWDSLHFQPEFTATAANIGYGWWSHDIGGHFDGVRDDQLLTRWVQFGVFSPILRLHSGADPFNRREPWRLGEPAERVVGEWLRLRHRLVPYLATMMHRAHHSHRSLVAPMYHDHPWADEAYDVPNQYTFGTHLVVAPITTPIDDESGLARVTAWLPPGDAVDLLTGTCYRGGQVLALYRDLDSIPVLARAGTVLPLVPADRVGNDVGIPGELDLVVVPGADGVFRLEEGDDDRRAVTELTWVQSAAHLVVEPVDDDVGIVGDVRDLAVVLLGFGRVVDVEATVDGVDHDVERSAPDPRGAIRVTLGPVPTSARTVVTVVGDATLATSDHDARLFRVLDRARIPRATKRAALTVLDSSATRASAVGQLQALDLPAGVLGALTELLLAP